MKAHISLRFSPTMLQAVFTANTPISGHIFIQFIMRPSALPLSLSLSLFPSQLVCQYPPHPNLLLPSSLPHCPNSFHKMSHLLTHFMKYISDPIQRAIQFARVHRYMGGEALSFSGRIYVSSPSMHNDTWHSKETIHNACQSNPF